LEERFSEDEFQPDKWAPPEAQVGGACGPLPTTILRTGEAKEGRELDTETRGRRSDSAKMSTPGSFVT